MLMNMVVEGGNEMRQSVGWAGGQSGWCVWIVRGRLLAVNCKARKLPVQEFRSVLQDVGHCPLKAAESESS
jgi:hypothetical protein